MQKQDNPPVIFDHPSREFLVTNASQAHCHFSLFFKLTNKQTLPKQKNNGINTNAVYS